ncbi:MAG: hypothetical protein EOP21_01755 [Hyphomicrobiales bacterium]|nr:MAG: hypothetical protein EOP21_01755 [Hyphomicrobiales bacterium]
MLIWWGSFKGGGATLGDLWAVNNLSADLNRHGIGHQIISSSFDWPGHRRVEHLFYLRHPKLLVFVCGPLASWRKLNDFLDIHSGAGLIAAGVSVLANQPTMVQRFDRIVARDGVAGATFDLAISKVTPPIASEGIRRVGLCLRGRQNEFGRATLHDKAEAMILALIGRHKLEVLDIDTVLRPGNMPADIEAAFNSVDCVLTTRMHGGLMSLAAGKPVIAIDQVPGTAKVSEVMGRTGWPHVFSAAAVDDDQLEASFASFSSPGARAVISDAQQRMLRLSTDARSASVAAIAEMLLTPKAGKPRRDS